MKLSKIKIATKENFKQMWLNEVVNTYEMFKGRESELEEVFESFFVNADIQLFNTHKNLKKTMNMIDFVDTIYEDDVIVIENGVMFSSKEEDMSPAVMTEEYLKRERGVVKKQANYNLTEGDKVKGKIQNIVQDNIKLLMNKNMFRTRENGCARFC